MTQKTRELLVNAEINVGVRPHDKDDNIEIQGEGGEEENEEAMDTDNLATNQQEDALLTMLVEGTKSDDELSDSGDQIESDKVTNETINTQRSKDTNIDSDSSNDDKSESESENSEVNMFEDDSLVEMTE